MRPVPFAALAASCLAACATAPDSPAAEPEAAPRYSFWRPAPVVDAPDPNKVVQEAPADAWRPVDPANLLVIELKEGGRIVIELAPGFAPVHVANVRAFARAGWWDGAAIYRVQDNYVAQWGNGDARTELPAGVVRAAARRISSRPRGPSDPAARLSRQLCADGRPCRRLAGRLRSGGGPRLAHPLLRLCRRRPRPRAGHRDRRRALRGDRPRAPPPRSQHRGDRPGRRGHRPALRPAARHRGARLLQGSRPGHPDRPGPARRRHSGRGAPGLSR